MVEVDYRREQYLRMEFPAELAEALALEAHVDWHKVEAMLAKILEKNYEDPFGLAFLIAV